MHRDTGPRLLLNPTPSCLCFRERKGHRRLLKFSQMYSSVPMGPLILLFCQCLLFRGESVGLDMPALEGRKAGTPCGRIPVLGGPPRKQA